MTLPAETVDVRAQRAHERTIVVDGLGGSAWEYEPIIAGGVTAVNVTLASSTPATPVPVLKEALRYHWLAETAPDRLLVVGRCADIVRAKETGRLGVILGVQGCDFLEGDIDLVEVLQRMGLRIAQLTYSERNRLGSGCLEPEDHGLTAFGRQVVRECDRVGVVVDLSHAGERTALDAVDASDRPVILSHANVRALNDNPRCVRDDLIRAVAGSGGVTGVSAYATFAETRHGSWPTIDDLVRHLAYVAELVGVEHVGLGTDMFEGRSNTSFVFDVQRRYGETLRPYSRLGTRMVQGLPSMRYLPRVTAALLSHGFDEDEVTLIMGGNFLRVFEKVWQ